MSVQRRAAYKGFGTTEENPSTGSVPFLCISTGSFKSTHIEKHVPNFTNTFMMVSYDSAWVPISFFFMRYICSHCTMHSTQELHCSTQDTLNIIYLYWKLLRGYAMCVSITFCKSTRKKSLFGFYFTLKFWQKQAKTQIHHFTTQTMTVSLRRELKYSRLNII